MKNDISNLVKDFCEFAYLQDNSAAELPNIQTSLNQFLGNEKVKTWLKNWDFSHWDSLDDPLTSISPEFLAYIVLISKYYWKERR